MTVYINGVRTAVAKCPNGHSDLIRIIGDEAEVTAIWCAACGALLVYGDDVWLLPGGVGEALAAERRWLQGMDSGGVYAGLSRKAVGEDFQTVGLGDGTQQGRSVGG